MKKIFLISFGIFDYDGRLRELCNLFDSFSELVIISRGSYTKNSKHILINSNYFLFIIKTISYIIKNDFDFLVLDNRKSIIPGMIVKSIKKNIKIILDCRELYIAKDVRKISSKIGCYIERVGINNSNLIISANNIRADLMKEIYGLKYKPLVFENYRSLKYTKDINIDEVAGKINKYINNKNEMRIISTAGCDLSRKTDILVENLSKIDYNIKLILVGSSRKKDIEKIKRIIKERKMNNIEILTKLKENELKYLISNCHIGIVNYSHKGLNNEYCASGKIYEFLLEGLPVVTTTNPTLVEFCDKYKIGYYSDEYYDAIIKLIENYNSMKKNVEVFCKKTKDINKDFEDRIKGYINGE